MDRKRFFNILRIVVSAGLIIFVCSQIRLRDHLTVAEDVTVDARGEDLAGRSDFYGYLQPGEDDDLFRIKTRELGIVVLRREQLKEQDGNLAGLQRGLVTVLRNLNWAWFVPTFFWVGLVPVIGAFRWRMLLRLQGVRLRASRAVSLTFLGYFFNNFLLGLTGGDVVKAYYVARETHRKTEAVVTVFFDRVVGLIALAILAAVMVLVRIGDPKFQQAAVYVWVFLIMACYCLLVLYSRRLRRHLHYTMLVVAAVGGGLVLGLKAYSRGWASVQAHAFVFLAIIAVMAVFLLVAPLRRMVMIDRVLDRLRKNKMVRDMDRTFHVFASHLGVTVAVFAISFVCHFITLTSVYGFARSLGIDRVDFYYFLVFVPVIVMISAMPISLAGWGVQEAVYQVFFGSVGVGATEAITLSFVYRLCAALLWSLPGGFAWMLSRDRTSLAEAERVLSETDDRVEEEPAT